MARTTSVRMIRDQARTTAKRSIDEAQERYGLKLTSAAKKLVIHSIEITLGEKSPDIARIGRVEQVSIKAGQRRVIKAVVAPELDIVKSTRAAIVQVFEQVAGGRKEKTVVTAADLEAAIRARWCHIFPFCGESIGKRMGLKVEEGDLK